MHRVVLWAVDLAMRAGSGYTPGPYQSYTAEGCVVLVCPHAG